MENFLTKDKPRLRKKYIAGNAINFKLTDPFGYWYVSFEKGGVPREFDGAFTTFDYALKAAENWAKNHNQELSDTPVEIPELKYKKAPSKKD
jgi:hypothetical protein